LKAWVIILLFGLSGSLWAEDKLPADDAAGNAEQGPITWVDSGHAYATDKTQNITQWMDNFFGDPINDFEQAESFLRLELIDDWEDEDGHDFKARLRGKVQLPQISKRLDLVFAGEENLPLDEDELDEEDSVGLQYKVLSNVKSRFDLTLGVSTGGLRPGVRFRYEQPLGELASYRVLQRVQHENDEGFYSTTQLDIYRAIGSDNSLRWGNRVRYGEETDGAEWRSSLALRQRYLIDTKRPIATSLFFVVNGVTEPEKYTKNYRLGFLFRRQVYRDFLFMEVQPAYNYRKRDISENRHHVWSIVFKLEIALEKDLRRVRKEENTQDEEPAAARAEPSPATFSLRSPTEAMLAAYPE